jgi:signal transduction histidine kinase/DNA-binding response OmpR family regulator
VGTDEGGLNRFNETDQSFTAFNIGLEYYSIQAIYEDEQGRFWVGTYQKGIYLFDREKGVVVDNITEKDGLPSDLTKSILEDGSGNLWVGTDNGLSMVDPENRRVKSYLNSGSREGNRYLRSSALKISTGEMLFGAREGFIIFHPDSIKDDPVPPQVVISDVSLFNRPDEELTFGGFISDLDEVELAYNENDLRFDYVGLHYSDPSKNQYKYMLENFDEDWIDAGTQRNATYTNLDAGEYVFRVTACNRDGVWNEEGASLKIIIPPPFWATWWAYTLYVLFILGMLYSIRRYELGRTHLKNQLKLDEVKLKEREETDKLKSRFFANISHEFRTPLTLILGPSENIVSNSKEEETQKSASTIKRNANRLLGLINQLLDLSKLEAGKLKLKASKNNIVPFIKGVTMSFESVAERKDITLRVQSSKNEIDLYFDKEKMTKIMTNLLMNACKFTLDGGAVTVALTLIPSPSGRGMSDLPAGVLTKAGGQGEGKMQIIVKDTGVGISEEELPKLFDRFYQVDSSHTREHEGTGIGLALTKELVELHHGTISATSETGKGTEFTILLPVGRNHLKDEEIVETEVVSDEVILTPDTIGMKNLKENNAADSSHFDKLSVTDNEVNEDKNIILLVEDNVDVREFIKDSLGNEFQIEEASNGEQGVRKAEQIIPDLIISDVMMPKMDGNELTKRLKNDEKTSHIPIILLTAKSEQQSKLEGLETGADAYLTKPFDTKELQVRINNLISIRRKLQAKFGKDEFIPAKKTEEKKLTNLEEQFMCKVMEVIENHISEEEFSIEQFGKEVGMSRVQLHRKLKALSGKSASNYLRSVRLGKAKKMIEQEKGNISEIAYSVGFSSPQYFTRCFKEEFGFPPSDLS